MAGAGRFAAAGANEHDLAGRDRGFLVHNADILSNLDISWFISQVRPEALSTLLVNRLEADRYLLFDDSMRLVGWTNVSTGEVRSPYPDLDVKSCRKLAFSGIHNVSTAILPMMQSWPEKFNLTPCPSAQALTIGRNIGASFSWTSRHSAALQALGR